MSRGGSRIGAGAKSVWNNPPTTTIRVPLSLANKLLDIAKILDNNEPIEKITAVLFSQLQNQMTTIDNNLVINSIPQYNNSDNMPRKIGIEALYYITHFNNIASILEKGILSHSQIDNNQVAHTTIYNNEIINRRANKIVINNKSLWDFASLYFQPRNAMLYSLVNKISIHEIAIICLKSTLLQRSDIFITNGNAASDDSSFFSIQEGKKYFKEIRDQIDHEWWNKDDGSKRKLMAECLIPDSVSPKYIQTIYVATEKAKKSLISNKLENYLNDIPIVVDPKKFFQPESRKLIKNQLYLVQGDMFFSKMQTLTISVNCVGVMGKGLASTAKYRFPDVYVKYEELCKKKLLKMGLPCLYKRESSVLDELYDDYLTLQDIDNNSHTWFLLFPTKNHWKQNSDLVGIEEGLKWIEQNYKKEGIKSLAIPALGCGLGGLQWQDVGPLMCKYLINIDIPVAIYLPTEKTILPEFLSNEFLLSQLDF